MGKKDSKSKAETKPTKGKASKSSKDEAPVKGGKSSKAKAKDEAPAKTKGKASKAETKPTKGGKAGKSKGKGHDDFARPSEAPAGDGAKWPVNKNNIGKLMLVTPLREVTVANKLGDKGDTKQQIISDVVIINEKNPAKSELIEEAEMEGGWVLGALRGFIGESRVLGRLGQDAAKGKGDRAAWVLEDADDDDYAAAQAYVKSIDPFKQTAKDKAKGKNKGKGK